MASVAGIFAFAYSRPGGVLTHPELFPHTDAINDVLATPSAGPPIPPPVDPPAPPLPPGSGGTGPRISTDLAYAQTTGSRGVDRLFTTTTQRREYPDVPQVKDEFAQRTIKLLWDQVWDLHAKVREANAAHATLAADVQKTKADVTAAHQLAQAANVLASTPSSDQGTFSPLPGGDSGLPGPSDPGVPDDGGQGAAGCASCGLNGHVPAGSSLTSFVFGQIICGCGKEFPALLDVTVDQPTRDANALQLLGRMIWHAQLAGFICGRQRNPSGVISGDKIAVQINGAWLAYDVFQGVDYTQPLPVHCIIVGIGNLVPDSGIPD